MPITKGLWILSIVILGCCLCLMAGEVYAFIISVLILFITLVALFIMVLTHITWKMIPQKIKTKYPLSLKQFQIMVYSSLLLLYCMMGVIHSLTALEASESHIQTNKMADLTTLPYLEWVPVGEKEKKGVVHYEPDQAWQNFNVFCSETKHEAYLMDMNGRIVHQWIYPLIEINNWHHAELRPNGDLFVLAAGQSLLCLDWNSTLKWKAGLRVHHDLDFDDDNRIYVITNKREIVSWHGIPVPIINDYVVTLSPEGKILQTYNLYEAVMEYVPGHCVSRVYRAVLSMLRPDNLFSFSLNKYKSQVKFAADILHTNSIEIMNRDMNGFCHKEDWLVSMRELDLVGIITPETLKLTWHWGAGRVSRQHHPSLLKNGNLLIFDNGPHRGYSRIIELNPTSREIVWEYQAPSPDDFFSSTRGSSQRLPNGNTLITESDRGRAFEVNRDGKIVWEFYNPHINEEKNEREAFYRMTRITNPGVDALLTRQFP